MDAPRWLPDERALAGAEHLDADLVAGYDRKAGFDPTDDVALLTELGLDRSSTVVELGAGTGRLALAVAPLAGRVVAVDPSPTMLEAVAEGARRVGARNVECVDAGFLGYVHAGEPARFVYSRNALHHLPDFWKAVALRRVAEMLAPGGILRLRDIVFSFEPAETEGLLEAWFAAAPGDAAVAIRDRGYSDSRTYAAYICVKA